MAREHTHGGVARPSSRGALSNSRQPAASPVACYRTAASCTPAQRHKPKMEPDIALGDGQEPIPQFMRRTFHGSGNLSRRIHSGNTERRADHHRCGHLDRGVRRFHAEGRARQGGGDHELRRLRAQLRRARSRQPGVLCRAAVLRQWWHSGADRTGRDRLRHRCLDPGRTLLCRLRWTCWTWSRQLPAPGATACV